jgi:hypothetical protein
LGKSTPRAPDPYKVSDAEAKASKDVAAWNQSLNMVGQNGPFGSISYQSNGVDPTTGAPRYTQNTSLSPELQQLLNSQISAQGGISDAITGAIGRLPTGAFDSSGINTDNIAKASYDSQVARLQPQFDEGFTKLQGMLSDRGLPIGSELATNEFNRFDRAKNESLAQASRQAQLDAGNEQSRQFNQLLTEYNQPVSQLSALMGNSSAVQNPSFANYPTASAQAPNVSQNVWNAYNANAQQAQQQNGQLWNGLLGIGQLGMSMFSDRRLKRDIKRIGALPSGLNVYSYRYVFSDGEQIGVMAQEALVIAPHAVSMHPSGYFMVNYGLL